MTRETKPNSPAGPNPYNQEASSCPRNQKDQEIQERRRAQIQVKILRHWCCQESQQRLTAEAESAGARKTNGAETGSTVQAAAGGRQLGAGSWGGEGIRGGWRDSRREARRREVAVVTGGGGVGWFRRAWGRSRDGWGKAPRKQGGPLGVGLFCNLSPCLFILFFSLLF